MGNRNFPAWCLILFPAYPGFFTMNTRICQGMMKIWMLSWHGVGMHLGHLCSSELGSALKTIILGWAAGNGYNPVWLTSLGDIPLLAHAFHRSLFCIVKWALFFAASFDHLEKYHLLIKIVISEGQRLYILVSVWFNLNPCRMYCIYSLSFVFWFTISEATWRCAEIWRPCIHAILIVCHSSWCSHTQTFPCIVYSNQFQCWYHKPVHCKATGDIKPCVLKKSSCSFPALCRLYKFIRSQFSLVSVAFAGLTIEVMRTIGTAGIKGNLVPVLRSVKDGNIPDHTPFR